MIIVYDVPVKCEGCLEKRKDLKRTPIISWYQISKFGKKRLPYLQNLVKWYCLPCRRAFKRFKEKEVV